MFLTPLGCAILPALTCLEPGLGTTFKQFASNSGMPKSKVSKQSTPDILIITGLSGSGMSSATNAFEDLGYFCVDNLPITILSTFARLIEANQDENGISRAALVIDIREGTLLADFSKQLSALRANGLNVYVLFLEA